MFTYPTWYLQLQARKIVPGTISPRYPDSTISGRRAQLVDVSALVSLLGLVFELGERGADGDGIGLYLVSRLAQIYAGRVTVGESPTGGAAFQVELPTTSG